MSPPALVSPLEYLETSYRPDCDYLEGELLERNVGEWDHSRLQGLILHFLMSREKEWGIYVMPEQRVQVKPKRYRVPDITVLVGDPPEGPIVRSPPFLCIEILSRADRIDEMQERIADYLNFGVPYVWAIDPANRRGLIYTQGAMREAKDGILTTSNPEIRVPLFELE